MAWLRLRPRSSEDPSTPSTAAPSKATPITVVLRDDLTWLLSAYRAIDPILPDRGATAEVAELLEALGASFAQELAAATGRLPEDLDRALWDGVSRGLFLCDGFSAIRSKVRGRPPGQRSTRHARLRRTRAPGGVAAGRWSLVPRLDAELDAHDLGEAVAEQLLARWGVVVRELVSKESLRLPWREVQWALRRMEDRGVIRGGRFVAGFSGEQFALSSAVDELARVRRLPHRGERVRVNATDPLNLVGVILPGESLASVRKNAVVYEDGLPVESGPELGSTSRPLVSAQ